MKPKREVPTIISEPERVAIEQRIVGIQEQLRVLQSGDLAGHAIRQRWQELHDGLAELHVTIHEKWGLP